VSVTARDILLDADTFRRAYPHWPHPEPEPVTSDSRYDSVRTMLHNRYNGVIPVTDEMVLAVLDAIDEEAGQ
jgi:hypothetical protein